jgi:hypothetical protein
MNCGIRPLLILAFPASFDIVARIIIRTWSYSPRRGQSACRIAVAFTKKLPNAYPWSIVRPLSLA